MRDCGISLCFTFGVSSDKFEKALQDIGEILGYISQRPDQEIRKGPDNLWCDHNIYAFFEYKSEVKEDRKAITKAESGQFNNHCGWFKSKYPNIEKVFPVLIIPTKDLYHDAFFTDTVWWMGKKGIKNLKNNIKEFFNQIKDYRY